MSKMVFLVVCSESAFPTLLSSCAGPSSSACCWLKPSSPGFFFCTSFRRQGTIAPDARYADSSSSAFLCFFFVLVVCLVKLQDADQSQNTQNAAKPCSKSCTPATTDSRRTLITTTAHLVSKPL